MSLLFYILNNFSSFHINIFLIFFLTIIKIILDVVRYLQQFKKFNLTHFQIFSFMITNSMLLEKKYRYFLIFIRFFNYLSRKFVNIYERN